MPGGRTDYRNSPLPKRRYLPKPSPEREGRMIGGESGSGGRRGPGGLAATGIGEPGGVLGWFRELSAMERRTFWACFAGWALDALDVQIYSFVIPTLIAVWNLSKTEAGVLGTVALLFSAVGGWIAGILSDR